MPYSPLGPLPQDLQNLYDVVAANYKERLYDVEANRQRWGKIHARNSGPLSIARAINGMAQGSLDGYEREHFEENALQANVPFDPHCVLIRWIDLLPKGHSARRDLTVAGSGGYLVGTALGAAADALRPWSVVARAGISVLDGLESNFSIPRVTAPPTSHVQLTEATAITASTPVLSQAPFAPKTLSTFVQYSRQLSLQSGAEQLCRTIMMSALGTFLDQQVLNGSGVGAEMLGLLNTVGVQTQSGTSLSLTGVSTMKKLCGEANAADEPLAFLSTPAVRALLEIRPRDATTGSGFIWDADRVAGRPAYASTTMPAATMVVGPWPLLVLGLWGDGFQFEINPYEATNFRAGIIQARLILPADIGVIFPAAFVKATSIT